MINISTEIDIPTKTFPSRGKAPYTRHLGFAFVEFSTVEDADTALAKFDGSVFHGRTLHMKKALPPLSDEDKAKRNAEYKERVQKANEEKRQRKEQARQVVEKAPPVVAESKVPEGEPSDDTIFITNLDYRVTSQMLNGFFEEMLPSWIYVPVRRLPWFLKPSRLHPPSNKGIAFIRFALREIQQQAIERFNGTEVLGRNIVVDVAINTDKSKDEDKVKRTRRKRRSDKKGESKVGGSKEGEAKEGSVKEGDSKEGESKEEDPKQGGTQGGDKLEVNPVVSTTELDKKETAESDIPV